MRRQQQWTIISLFRASPNQVIENFTSVSRVVYRKIGGNAIIIYILKVAEIVSTIFGKPS